MIHDTSGFINSTGRHGLTGAYLWRYTPGCISKVGAETTRWSQVETKGRFLWTHDYGVRFL